MREERAVELSGVRLAMASALLSSLFLTSHPAAALPRFEPCRSLQIQPARLEVAHGLMRLALEAPLLRAHPEVFGQRRLQVLAEPIRGGEWLLTLLAFDGTYRLGLVESMNGSIVSRQLESLDSTGVPEATNSLAGELFETELPVDLGSALERVLAREVGDRREQTLIAMHQDYYSVIALGSEGFVCGQVTSAISPESRLNAVIDLFGVLVDLASGRGGSAELTAEARRLLSDIARSRDRLSPP